MKGGENMDGLAKIVKDETEIARLYSRLLVLYETKNVLNKELQKKIDDTEKELLAKGEKIWPIIL